MRIAILSDWESSGGANVAAVRLTEGFADAGHDITRIYQHADVHDPRFNTRIIRSHWATQKLSLPRRLAWRVVPNAVRQQIHERSSEEQLAEILTTVRPDVINIHNLHIGRWSAEMIRIAAAHAPVVVKLCDTWTFTGRCYNPGPCDKYLTACDDQCPTADEYPSLAPNRIRPAFELKREILETCTNVAAVAPSRWIGHLASAGLWKHRPVFRIANGIDLRRYAPTDRDSARRTLGIPSDRPVLLCSAGLLSERKKGLHLLVEALATGLATKVRLLLLGSLVDLPRLTDVEVHSLGYVADDAHKAAIYNSADLYVHPSLADNSPNTVIESLACGTPAVAFPVDGVPEMVVPGQTGWLTTETTAESLRMALSSALDALATGVRMRESCRQFAVAEFDVSLAVRRYERVFLDMVAGGNVAAGLKVVA